jgi:hypothetical protein
MVDRICTGRTIDSGGIDVSTEPAFGGNIVVLDPPRNHDHVPFGGPGVVLPRTPREAQYFYERKVSVLQLLSMCVLYT